MKQANPLYVPTDISRAPKPRLDRPARQQVKEEPKESQDNVVGEYNIWYHRHLGYDEKKDKPTTRLDPIEDTGLTTSSQTSNICLNFARGNCVKGYKCQFKHQIPTEDDELRVSMLKDVFGRSRHGTDREDMDGTGNFNRNNRTLYIGAVVSKDDVRETEKLVKNDWEKFGEIEYVRVIPTKAIAFVRFKLRVAAEFGKEAMAGQETPYGEIEVKWAHLDPNPLAKEFDKRADEALAQYAIAKRIQEMSGKNREAWAQMHMVENGVYPTGPVLHQQQQQQQQQLPPPPAQQMLPPPVQAPPGIGQPPPGIGQPPPGVGQGPPGIAPPGMDPGRAQQFAEYWANFHAQQTAQKLGVEAPNQNLPKVQPITPGSAIPQAPKTFTNPHTGEVVKDDFAVNPYSQAPHPYAYRDYGWNRPKKKQESEAEKERKRKKREIQDSMLGDVYDAQSDPNYDYGPAGQKKEKRALARQSSGTVTPGRPIYPPQQQYPQQGQQQQVLIPLSRGRVAKATESEVEALTNDEPLAFE